jgi:cytochrome c556
MRRPITKPMTKRIVAASSILLASIFPAARAQAPTPTMKQLMLDLIHPASNEIILTVNRGGPSDDKEWAAMRRSALALAESGNSLAAQRQPGSEAWKNAAKQLADAGSEAYKAAQAKDAKALAAVTPHIDASCTNCHKQFRPNVFPSRASVFIRFHPS